MKQWLLGLIIILLLVAAGGMYFTKEKAEKITDKTTNGPVNETKKEIYDVIVIGGEPEGVAAAVRAARNGAKVLLVEEREALGGLITFGMLNYLDIPQNKKGDVLSEGIFKEWWDLVGGKSVNTVDIQTAKDAFLTLVKQEENITLKLSTKVIKPIMEGKNVKGVVVKHEGEEKEYVGKRFIDSTAEADFAAMTGVPYTVGREDIGEKDAKMAVTLMIHLTDVDWNQVKKAAKDGVLGGSGINETAAWGFPDVLNEYQEIKENTSVRGLNIGRTKQGDIYINALQIFGIDGLSEDSKKQAIQDGIEETDAFVVWLKEHLPGFEHAKIASYPEELYIRETRHIQSEYRLSMADVWENTYHDDAIAFGGYPVDVQAMEKGHFGNVMSDPDQYSIPFRSIVPREVNHLLVASKASGYDSLPAGSARVIPTGMAVAEAAGLIAANASQNNLNFREMTKNKMFISDMQSQFVKQKMYFKKQKTTEFPYQDHPDYPALKFLYSYDLITGGYENDFALTKEMNGLGAMRMIKTGMKRMDPLAYKEKETLFNTLETELTTEPLKEKEFNDLIQKITGGDAAYSFKNKTSLTREDVYPVIAEILLPYDKK